MQSKAKTVAAYLKELPPDRRAAIAAVREMVLANVDRDSVQETMGYGMIGFSIPHRVFPQGYHCDPSMPVPYIALASQKQYMSLYLMGVYGGSEDEAFLRDGFAKAGLRIDLGKCCLRFKRLEDLDLDVVAQTIRRLPAREYLARYVAAVPKNAWKASTPSKGVGEKPVAKKTAAKKTAAPKEATPKKAAAKRRPAAKK
jgi:hypothetical protein